MMLTLQDFVMLAKFIMSRDEPGGSVKIFDQSPHQADYVVIDWPISAQLLEEFNLIRGDGFTSEKPTKPGVYWYRDARRGTIIVQCLAQQKDWKGDNFVYVEFIGSDEGNSTDEMTGEWSGPLEPQV